MTARIWHRAESPKAATGHIGITALLPAALGNEGITGSPAAYAIQARSNRSLIVIRTK